MNIKNIKLGLKMETESNEEKKVIKLKGAIIFLNASKLLDYATKELDGTDKLVIDMSEIESIDETALEKLSALKKKAQIQEKELEIINCNEKTSKRIEKFIKVL